MNSVSPTPSPTALDGDGHRKKLSHAARQFEAVLLNQLLGSLQQTFSALGEERASPGSDQYRFLGIQALCSTISEHGGIGIADMIMRDVQARENRSGTIKKPL